MLKSLRTSVDALFFQEYRLPAQTLGLFRIFFVCYSAFILGLPRFMFLGSLPDYIFYPQLPSIATFFSGFPSYYALLLLCILILLLHITILIGYKTKLSSVLVTILMIIGYSFEFSLGKINHDRMILIWTPLMLGLANWGAAYSIDAKFTSKPQKTRAWPVFLLLSMFAFGMFSAGFPKLMGGWLNIHSQAVRGYLVKHYVTHTGPSLMSSFFMAIHSTVIWESLDYTAVIFELSFIIFLFCGKKCLRLYFIVGICFHIMNLLMLNISFVANLPIYMLLFPWQKVFRKANASNLSRQFTLLYLFLLGATISLFYAFNTNFSRLIEIVGINHLYFNLILMIIFLGIYLYGISTILKKSTKIKHSVIRLENYFTTL